MELKREKTSPPSRIKILHLITDLEIGGAEMMLYKLLSVMDQEVFENQVVSLEKVGVLGGKIQALGWPVYSLEMARGIPSPFALLKLCSLLKRENPQILQSWLYHADLLGAIAVRRMKKVRLVWNVRCAYMDFSRYRFLTRWVVRACAQLSHLPAAVIVNSNSGRAFHERQGYRPKRWEWIPNGFDLNAYHPDPIAGKEVRRNLGLSEKDLLIGMVARFDPMKDMDTFLQAAMCLQEKMPKVSFVLVGAGLEENNPFFQSHPGRRVLGDRLRLLGYRKDVPRILCALDLAVSTSLGEGFPNAIGEAMACGIPCVVTDAGDSAFLVGDGGSVVQPGDPEGMAAEWERMLRLSAEERRRIGRMGRKRVEDSFGLEAIKDRYERFYRGLIFNEQREASRDDQK